ncbi:MAG TPA: GIY-YIG nuclease family protein [Chloroflexota bacterium]|nr:GIY-YIG nuclease family protein [Chloroflexota bacterium]HUM71871.1 GIY-YIG nuclease family protein [Chloroflexota bacterium]
MRQIGRISKVDERRRNKGTGEVTTNDEPQWYIRNESKTMTFSVPCVVSFSNQPQEQRKYFFLHSGVAKRGRKIIGWDCYFDRHDVLYNRFISRFYDEGNLALGQKRYWCVSSSYLSVRGIDWPVAPKFNTDTMPRKSKIASQPKDDIDYVYLIRMGRTKFYKIGKSNDPQGRLASMQTASPYKLKMQHVFKADNAAAAEETLHHKLHGARMKGEWFKLTDEEQKVIARITAFEDGQFIMGGGKAEHRGTFLG